MTRYFFNLLEEEQQEQVLLKKGIVLGERRTKTYRILLYGIDAFYIEVYYHFHFNVIHKIRSFKNMAQLDPYLNAIDLDGLW